MQTRTFTDDSRSILDVCGVVALVRLSGPLQAGTDIPQDDPPTTVRAAAAEVLELHLHPRHEPTADALHRRYGVPVAVYDLDEWPMQVRIIAGRAGAAPKEDVEAFCAAVAVLDRFGTKSTADPATFLGIGRHVVAGLRAGISTSDAARVLFESNARPTWAQALAFAEAAVQHLAPDLASVAPTYPLALPPVRLVEKVTRASLAPITGALR